MKTELSKDHEDKLFNIWRVSKVHVNNRYERMMYTCRWFLKENPDCNLSHTAIYKQLERLIVWW